VILKILQGLNFCIKFSSTNQLPKNIRLKLLQELDQLDFGYLDTEDDRELLDGLFENLET